MWKGWIKGIVRGKGGLNKRISINSRKIECWWSGRCGWRAWRG